MLIIVMLLVLGIAAGWCVMLAMRDLYEDARTGRDRGGALAEKIMIVAAGIVFLLLWMGAGK